MADVSDTPDEAKYSMEEVIHMDKCGVLPEDFKKIRDFENTQFDQIDWKSFMCGIEAGALQCMEDLGKKGKMSDDMRTGMFKLMEKRESDPFRGRHMRNISELIVGIISGKVHPRQIK